MSNFVEMLLDALHEKGKTMKDLEDNVIIPKRSFYQYKTYTPFLPTILKIVNYLEMSLDYFTDRTSTNNFKAYKLEQKEFYNKLISVMKQAKISQSRLAKDLEIGRHNFSYWKNGSFPKFTTLIEIANYLNCNIDDLLETER